MKAQHGSLKVNVKYDFLEITKGAFFCENCGMGIINIASVRDTESGAVYRVGTECLETILQYSAEAKWQAMQELKKFRRIEAIIRKVRKGVYTYKMRPDGAMEVLSGRFLVAFLNKKTADQYKEVLDKPIKKVERKRHLPCGLYYAINTDGMRIKNSDGYNGFHSLTMLKRELKGMLKNAKIYCKTIFNEVKPIEL